MNQLKLFESTPIQIKANQLDNPKGYKGLYTFHKYWGKKPAEALSFLIQNFSKKSDVVLDPFMGSGTTGIESIKQQRRFIGIDVNPVATDIATLLTQPPEPDLLDTAIKSLEHDVKNDIFESYRIGKSSHIASHYLWEDDKIREIWVVGNGKRKRTVIEANKFDNSRCKSFKNYQLKYIRDGRFFTNSRINSKTSLTLKDFFTGRALRNIELLISAIKSQPQKIQSALMLCLTSSSGQMSNMVFAIKRRGKTTGKESNRIEVGSWAIGLWRPALHFEINVWNCFYRKVLKLIKDLRESDFSAPPNNTSVGQLLKNYYGVSLISGDSKKELIKIPKSSIDLIITDPPHGDRIPYLELSEMWNSILNHHSAFDSEIVISNAKERKEISALYNERLYDVWQECHRVLKPGHLLIIVFNARQKESWSHFSNLNELFEEVGNFPLRYSAGSIVQDNRKGSLKTDYALVLQKKGTNNKSIARRLKKINGWNQEAIIQCP